MNGLNSLVAFSIRSTTSVATWSKGALVRTACVDDGGTDSEGSGKWKPRGAVLTLAGVLVLCSGYRDAKGT